MRQLVLLCLFALPLISVGAAEPVGQKYVYKTIDSHELVIYVTKPADWSESDTRPAILFFHGGGWVGGSPGQFTEHSKYFASRRMVCFQAQYRLLDKQGNEPPTVCIRDARSAMRWVRSRANEFGIDPNRIASAGGSAGGHLAATLGTINSHDEPGEDLGINVRSNAMILFNPVFDNGPGGWGTKRVGDRYPEFSPAHNITAAAPPTIVFLGDRDSLVAVATLNEFQAKMKTAGSRCDTLVFPGMPHGFFNHGKYENKPYVETVIAADRFLTSLKWLTGAPTLQSAGVSSPKPEDSETAK